MWLFTKHGFVSVVQAPDPRDGVVVRARRRNHLESILKSIGWDSKCDEIVHTPKADYAWRVTMWRDTWADIMSELADEIDYRNFKDECHDKRPDDHLYQRMLLQVWDAGYTMQQLDNTEDDDE